jgi:hypothetical protein
MAQLASHARRSHAGRDRRSAGVRAARDRGYPAAVVEFENPHLQGKSLEQLIDELGDGTAQPASAVAEMYRAAIQAKLAERLAAFRRLATIAVIAATVSVLAAAASAVAAF